MKWLNIGNKEPVTASSIKPVVLVVVDGFGIAPDSPGNTVTQAKTPNWDSLVAMYPNGSLIASGESAGLPANEVGNSEVGHLTLGVGRTIPQSLTRINMAIKDGSFFENGAFLKAVDHAKKQQSKLHLMGLVSSGNVHASLGHFYALLDFCVKQGISDIKLHLFTDGRDGPPNESVEVIAKIEEKLAHLQIGQIATISGRYYALDRDRRWERTKQTYDAIVSGKGVIQTSAVEAIKAAYGENLTDEFINPTVIVKDSKPVGTVDDDDAVIFFNFRIDRPRQLTMAFVLADFEKLKSFEVGYDPYKDEHGEKRKMEVISGPTFDREKWPQNLFFATMTQYQENLQVSEVAFPPEKIEDSLAEVIAKHGLKQLHMAESEKERMVTYYFNGLRQEKFEGEEVLIIPSPRVPTYDKKPEMSALPLLKAFKKAVDKSVYHFMVINFANPDMVAHSGNLKATIKAMEVTDKVLGELVEQVLLYDGVVLITSDHGNAEELLTYKSASYFFTTSEGEMNTDHSNNPVPLLVASRSLQGKAMQLPQGLLADVAPTILAIMKLPQPASMSGRNLLAEGNKE